ncbi:hypothetical protein [Pyrobaculum neutrophilum]|uniref:hypothetical protein n=1 Tax=Pyrobaculum neutrophilum TaxID=70771 RepID=UPI0011E53DEE|nr:hypothetical protein [Pyrobaculum neutrophilum]
MSNILLSITASPGVRAVTVTLGDRALAVHLYAKTAYIAAVARGVECRFEDGDLKRAAWLLAKLMDRVGRALKSRYYTYTGPLEVVEEAVRYRPYVSPTSTVEITLSGGRAAVVGGEFRRRFRTDVDVGGVLKKYIELLASCRGDETRLGDV